MPVSSIAPDHSGRTTQVASANSTIAGPFDLEALAHAGAPVDRHLAPVAVEVRLALPGLGVAFGLLGGELGRLDRQRRHDARVDELDVLALHPVAVAALVRLGEALLHGVEVVGLDGQLERLAAVAQVGAAPQLGVVHVLARLLLHRAKASSASSPPSSGRT